MEEEKQARVSQVSDLLGWVKGLQGRTGSSNTESSLAAQQVQQTSGSLNVDVVFDGGLIVLSTAFVCVL